MIGKVIAGFEILEQLGDDALGPAWLASAPGGRERVLLHLLPSAFALPPVNAVARETFARALLLHHPNILETRGFSDGRDGEPYLVEEHLPGVTLASLLDMNVKLLWTSALLVLHEVTAAIAHAHRQGVLHGDVAPGHVLLHKTGKVKVRGFGLGHLLEVAGLITGRRGVSVRPVDDVRAIARIAHDLVAGPGPGAVGEEEVDLRSLGVPDGYLQILGAGDEPPGTEASLGTADLLLAHIRNMLSTAGVTDLREGLQRAFEELSFFFLVAGSSAAQDDEPSSSPVPAGADVATGEPALPLAETMVLDADSLFGGLAEPAQKAAQAPDPPAAPTGWASLGGDEAEEVGPEPASPPSAEAPPEDSFPVMAPPPHRRAASAEFGRIAQGSSGIVWTIIGVLAVVLVIVAVVAVRSFLRNSAPESDEPTVALVEDGHEATADSSEPEARPEEPAKTPTASEEPSTDAGHPTPPVPQEPSRPSAATDAEAAALALIGEGKPVEARARLTAALDANPNDAGLLLVKARTYVATGSYDEAVATLQETIRADRERTDAYDLLGIAELERGNPGEARSAMQHILDKRGTDPDFLLRLAKATIAEGDLASAVPLLQQAISVRPDFPIAHLLLGKVYESQRLQTKATDEFLVASEEPALADEALTLVLKAYERQGKTAAVTKLFQERLARQPDLALLHLYLGEIFYRERKLAKAVEHFQRYAELRPGAKEALISLGNVAYRQGRFDDAARSYREALDATPGLPEAAHNLGMTLLAEGQGQEAVEMLTTAVAGSKELWQPRCELGRIYQEAGQLDKARDLYQAAHKLKADHPWLGQILKVRLDSVQAGYLMTKPCDVREIVEPTPALAARTP